MKQEMGVWIDHEKAFIVTVGEEGDTTRTIHSNYSKHKRPLPHERPRMAYGIGDRPNRQYNGHLNRFYDSVVRAVQTAGSLLILGPGEAKGEFKKRMKIKGVQDCTITLEAVDRMTERQIAAKTRNHFRSRAIS